MEECKMFLFKAVLMCQECGEIHGEKWLETRNRHASQTVIEMLCDSCKENELDFDPFGNEGYLEEDPFNREWTPDDEFEIMVEKTEQRPNHDDICPSCHAVAYQCNCFLEEDEDNE
jgi:hypothetical protein